MNSIEVHNIGKRYTIGHQAKRDTLRETLSSGLGSLWQRLRGSEFVKEDFWALQDISFSVQPGEVVGVVGRNGAGKSTLLKVLSRITEPTTGSITLRGRVASLLEVGTGFHPELSGRENIFLNGAILGMSRWEIRKKFDEIVAFAEVDRFLDTPVKRYSSGMYVRLAFSVAAHLDPEILIVDEVLAVGDARFQKKCLGKMKSVSKSEGRTVLFVSHQLQSVRSLCPKSILLTGGRLETMGPTDQVLKIYEGESEAGDAQTRVIKNTLPGLQLSSAKCSIEPSAASAEGFHDFLFEIAGCIDKPQNKYGFALHISTNDGIAVCHMGPRLLRHFIGGQSGPFVTSFRIAAMNRHLAGGRYELEAIVTDQTGASARSTNQSLVFDLPEADPYAADFRFSKALHGLVPLPVSIENRFQ